MDKLKIRYTVTKDNIHIEDSYKVTKEKNMMKLLTKIKVDYFRPDYFFYEVPYNTLLNEWKSHNLLYDLHIFRSHTKDADLNKNPWYIRIIYAILSKFYYKTWFS